MLGRHVILDCHDCDRALLDDIEGVKSALLAAADAARMTVVESTFHRFAPQGVSGVVVIAESHMSVHTWPEHGYAAVDIFTCGDADPGPACDHLLMALGVGEHSRRELPRGLRPSPPNTTTAAVARETLDG